MVAFYDLFYEQQIVITLLHDYIFKPLYSLISLASLVKTVKVSTFMITVIRLLIEWQVTLEQPMGSLYP